MIFSDKGLTTFSLRSESQQGCSFLPLQFKIALEVLATDIKGICTDKEKLLLFTDGIL